jgi:hypothetical protein
MIAVGGEPAREQHPVARNHDGAVARRVRGAEVAQHDGDAAGGMKIAARKEVAVSVKD